MRPRVRASRDGGTANAVFIIGSPAVTERADTPGGASPERTASQQEKAVDR